VTLSAKAAKKASAGASERRNVCGINGERGMAWRSAGVAKSGGGKAARRKSRHGVSSAYLAAANGSSGSIWQLAKKYQSTVA
jgi:hypothetical protein